MSQQEFLPVVTRPSLPGGGVSDASWPCGCGRWCCARGCTVSAWARAVPATTHLRYRLKRSAGFMVSRRLHLLGGRDALVRQAAALHPEGWLPLLLDETGVRDHATGLCRVRSLSRTRPAGSLSRLHPHPHSPRPLRAPGRADLALLPGPGRGGQPMVVVADRGFAASRFLRWLRHCLGFRSDLGPGTATTTEGGGGLRVQTEAHHEVPSTRHPPSVERPPFATPSPHPAGSKPAHRALRARPRLPSNALPAPRLPEGPPAVHGRACST